jgi:hypothetical protein
MQNLISTTDEKNINSIYLEMDRYWKYKNDFIEGILLYLKDLNKKHNLGITDSEIMNFSTSISTKLLMQDLTQRNTLYIISQFICYCFFDGQQPSHKELNINKLSELVDDIEETFVHTDLKDGLRIKLDRNKYLNNNQKTEYNKPIRKSQKVTYALVFGVIMAIIAGILAESQNGGADFGESLLPGFAIGAVIGLIYGASKD